MLDLPSGTVTFLFTDVEGSTRLLHGLGAEGLSDLLGRPVDNGLRCVVEHLRDNLPARPGIGGPFHLDQGRDSGLVEEQMVERPAARPTLFARNTRLASNQPKPPWLVTRELLTRKQLRKIREQTLKDILGLVRLLPHLLPQHQEPCGIE